MVSRSVVTAAGAGFLAGCAVGAHLLATSVGSEPARTASFAPRPHAHDPLLSGAPPGFLAEKIPGVAQQASFLPGDRRLYFETDAWDGKGESPIKGSGISSVRWPDEPPTVTTGLGVITLGEERFTLDGREFMTVPKDIRDIKITERSGRVRVEAVDRDRSGVYELSR